MCVYVCVCACVYVCMCVYMHSCARAHMYMCCMYVDMRMCVLYVCRCVCCVCDRAFVEVRGQLMGLLLFFFFILWVPEMELRPPDLTAGTFACRAISSAWPEFLEHFQS